MITISNPNDWEDDHPRPASPTSSTTAVSAPSHAGPYVVPKSGSLDVDYTCSYATAPSQLQRHQHRHRDLEQGTGLHPERHRLRRRRPFTLAQVGSTNKTVHVSDDKVGDRGLPRQRDGHRQRAVRHRRRSPTSGRSRVWPAPAPSTTTRPRSTETEQTASETVEVCVGKDLTVTKTATPYFTRTFTWEIAKIADKTKVYLEGTNPQTATFNYTVGVTHNAGTDSLWTIKGVITDHQPQRLGGDRRQRR